MFEIVRHGRLRWYGPYGHVKRKPYEDWVKRYGKMEIAGKVGRGRARTTYLQCANGDMKEFGIIAEDT